MSTGYVLLDQPQTTPQYRWPRRARFSGVIGLHTAQSIIDRIAPDDGDRNVTRFILTRGDYGSYHELHDWDSITHLAPVDCETWHIAETDAYGYGMNSHSYGIAAACRDTDWDPDDWWTQTVIPKMARSARKVHLDHGFGLCPRWLTRDEMKRRVPGVGLHGTVQPGDRTDAWTRHPRRTELETMFMTAYMADDQPRYQPDPGPDPKGDDMLFVKSIDNDAVYLYVHDRTGKYWVYEGSTREVSARGGVVISVPGDGTELIDELWGAHPKIDGPLAA